MHFIGIEQVQQIKGTATLEIPSVLLGAKPSHPATHILAHLNEFFGKCTLEYAQNPLFMRELDACCFRSNRHVTQLISLSSILGDDAGCVLMLIAWLALKFRGKLAARQWDYFGTWKKTPKSVTGLYLAPNMIASRASAVRSGELQLPPREVLSKLAPSARLVFALSICGGLHPYITSDQRDALRMR